MLNFAIVNAPNSNQCSLRAYALRRWRYNSSPVTQPDAAQAALLDRLGVVLPKRLRLAEREIPRLTATA
jgi:hypothetical protein